jgi:hypothetical protein
VSDVVTHDSSADDPTLPRPHAHITVVPAQVLYTVYEGWARYAHARYQVELQVRLDDLGIGVTRLPDTGHGWEVTAAIPQLGDLPRRLCGRALYPLDIEQAAAEFCRNSR